MQCPACRYEPTMAEMQSSPDSCSSCNINYSEYQAKVERQREERKAEAAAREKVPPYMREINASYPGAQPVVVVDLNMSFGAMVRFMVKWAVAAIPAAIILFVLFWGVVSFIRLI